MSESVADHFAEQADSQPDAPALIWDDRAISYGELRQMADAAHAELESLGLPDDRPVGIQARRSRRRPSRSILACLKARRPFLLPSIELAPETLAKLFGQADASRVLAPAENGDAALSAADLPEEEDLPASEWPPPGGGDDIAFMLTTSGSTGLPKIVPLLGGRHPRVHELGSLPVRHRPRSQGAQLRTAQLRPVPARHLEHAQGGRLRGDRGPGEGDARRPSRRAHRGQRGRRGPGGADAVPAADRRDERERPALPERQARDHDG